MLYHQQSYTGFAENLACLHLRERVVALPAERLLTHDLRALCLGRLGAIVGVVIPHIARLCDHFNRLVTWRTLGEVALLANEHLFTTFL